MTFSWMQGPNGEKERIMSDDIAGRKAYEDKGWKLIGEENHPQEGPTEKIEETKRGKKR